MRLIICLLIAATISSEAFAQEWPVGTWNCKSAQSPGYEARIQFGQKYKTFNGGAADITTHKYTWFTSWAVEFSESENSFIVRIDVNSNQTLFLDYFNRPFAEQIFGSAYFKQSRKILSLVCEK